MAMKDLSLVVPLSEKTTSELLKIKDPQKLSTEAAKASVDLYKKREKELTSQVMRQMESDVYLQILDTNWMQHLENMDHLRQGIGLRGIGQRDPLVEYRREGQKFFESMQDNIRNELVRTLFRLEPIRPEDMGEVETELTRAAKKSVEGGEKSSAPKSLKTKEDKHISKATRIATEPDKANKLDAARKKKKKQRKNRKKGRR